MRNILFLYAVLVSCSLLADTYTWSLTNGSGVVTGGSFETPSNWTLTSTGEEATEVPGENDDVIIPDGDTAYTVTVNNPFKVHSLTVGDAGGTTLATLNFKNGLSTNEVVDAVIVGAKGKLTHTAETATGTGISVLAKANYRLNLKAGGDITIRAGGSVDASACGFSAGNGPYPSGGSGQRYYGAAYGGTGVHNASATGSVDTYGSIRNPNDSGSGGGGRGGGVIYLESEGTLTVSGSVKATGPTSGSNSAGGSIIIKGNAIAGAGTVSVKGGYGATYPGGGGGRMAIYTKEDRTFGSLEFATLTAAGGIVAKSACGTIYFESAQHAPGCGEIVIDGKNQSNARYSLTIFNGNIRDVLQPFGAITVTGKANVCIQGSAKLTFTNGLSVASN